jgi:hypothetical protein
MTVTMQWFGKHVSTIEAVFREARAKEFLKNKRRYGSFLSSRYKRATESSSTCEDLKCDYKASFMCKYLECVIQ